MQKTAPLITALLLLSIGAANASNVGVDLNLQIGNPPPPPPPQVIVREAATPPSRVIVRETAPASTVIIEDDVDFIYPSQLGFYVAVGVPYDLFFLNNFYFTYRDGRWYRAPNHRGPWVTVERRHLPPGLRRHKLDRIRHYRDNEYRIYERERDHYRGRYFRSDKGEWKEHRQAQKEHMKEERRRDKAERRMEKEQRRDDKRWEKEDRGPDRDRDQGRHGRDR